MASSSRVPPQPSERFISVTQASSASLERPRWVTSVTVFPPRPLRSTATTARAGSLGSAAGFVAEASAGAAAGAASTGRSAARAAKGLESGACAGASDQPPFLEVAMGLPLGNGDGDDGLDGSFADEEPVVGEGDHERAELEDLPAEEEVGGAFVDGNERAVAGRAGVVPVVARDAVVEEVGAGPAAREALVGALEQVVVAEGFFAAFAITERDAGAVDTMLLELHVPAADEALFGVGVEGFAEGLPEELVDEGGEGEVDAEVLVTGDCGVVDGVRCGDDGGELSLRHTEEVGLCEHAGPEEKV